MHCGSRPLLIFPGNPFTVLGHDMSSPSTSPSYDFKFSCTGPGRLLATQTSSGSNTCFQTLPSGSSDPLVFLKSFEEYLPKTQEQSWSAVPLSIPNSPPVIAQEEGCIRPWTPSLPSRPNSPPLLLQIPSSSSTSLKPFDYADGIDEVQIPSPLLYHRDGDGLFSLPNDSLEDERLEAFLLSYGHDSPTPSVRSYDYLCHHNANKKLGDLQCINSSKLLARTESSSYHVPVGFRNIPQPPWIISSGRPTESQDSDEETNTSGVSSKRTELSTSPPSLEPCELLFPLLADAGDPNNADRSIEDRDCDHPAEAEFIDDDPETIERLWNAFEAVVSDAYGANRSSSWRFSPQSSLRLESSESSQGTFVQPQRAFFEIASCPTPACTALVPASLYRHQYFGWPRWHMEDYRESAFPFLGASIPAKAKPDTSLITEWCEGLGIGQLHEEGCRNTTDVVSSEPETANFSNTNVDDTTCSVESDDQDSTDQAVSASMDELLDEDGSLAYESACEVAHEEAALSDDDWAELDWEDEALWEEADGTKTEVHGDWDTSSDWEEVLQRLA